MNVFLEDYGKRCITIIKDNTRLCTLSPECDGYLFKKCEFYVATFSSFFVINITKNLLKYTPSKKKIYIFT
jgi:hypothetical protein